MASAEDELGSFFAEINEIESAPQEQAQEVTKVVIAAAAAPQVNKSAAQVIYTYETSESAEFPSIAPSVNTYRTDEGSLASFVAHHSSGTSSSSSAAASSKHRNSVRTGGGEVWVDETLNDWPENDYRIFVGDIGKEVNTDMLAKAFQHYKSFAKAKVVKSKVESKGRGYGFVSFLDPMDCVKAIREMNDKYLGSRPMKIRKSTWKDRDIDEVKRTEKKKRKIQESLGLVTCSQVSISGHLNDWVEVFQAERNLGPFLPESMPSLPHQGEIAYVNSFVNKHDIFPCLPLAAPYSDFYGLSEDQKDHCRSYSRFNRLVMMTLNESFITLSRFDTKEDLVTKTYTSKMTRDHFDEFYRQLPVDRVVNQVEMVNE